MAASRQASSVSISIRSARPHSFTEFCSTLRRKSSRMINDLTAWQNTKCGVHVIEARIDKLKRDHVRAESLLYHPPGRRHRIAGRIPSKTDFRSFWSHRQSPAPSSTRSSGNSLTASMSPSSRSEWNAALKYCSSGCRSGQRNRASNTVRSRTTAAFAVKTRSGKPFTGGTSSTVAPNSTTPLCNANPFPLCGYGKIINIACPIYWVHPWIYGICDTEVLRRAHQQVACH